MIGRIRSKRVNLHRKDDHPLKVISIKIPPLRERDGDILPLAEWLLDSERLAVPP